MKRVLKKNLIFKELRQFIRKPLPFFTLKKALNNSLHNSLLVWQFSKLDFKTLSNFRVFCKTMSKLNFANFKNLVMLNLKQKKGQKKNKKKIKNWRKLKSEKKLLTAKTGDSKKMSFLRLFTNKHFFYKKILLKIQQGMP